MPGICRIEARMISLNYEDLETGKTASDPFPHIVVKNFVPAERLMAVVGDLPAISQRGSFPTSALALGSNANSLIEELEGPRLREAIAKKFDLDLSEAPTMLTLRGQSTERDGHIHCDSTAKRVTVLLYLNPQTDAWARQEGCLRLLRGPDNIENYAVEVPPVNGNLLIFPNGDKTWHGHKPFTGQRFVIQLNYMTKDRAARSELRRHRVSAFVKRVFA